uniref:Peptidase A1 domain-containing protein n=2 Tax=Manihot esculenta TaxID=3983 RepID=A0A2C9VBE3_MANES
MAAYSSSSLLLLLIFFAFSFVVFASELHESEPFRVRPSIRPSQKLVLPVRKDGATNLHVATVLKRTPQVPLKLLVDLNGRFLSVECDEEYQSSTYFAPRCHSTQCSRAHSHTCYSCSSSSVRPGCHNNTCALTTVNPVSQETDIGELAQDALSIRTIRDKSAIDPSAPGPTVTVPQFLFVCARRLLNLVPKYVQGVAGLGHTSIALPTQLASHFGFRPNFVLCLANSLRSPGFVVFGEDPYTLAPNYVSPRLHYAPLSVGRQGEYYIQVRSIRVNNKNVPLKTNINRAKISTTTPFTVLEHSIFEAFTQSFSQQLSQAGRAQPVGPFRVCFDSRRIPNTIAGPGVPRVDFVVGDQSVAWTLFGANTMAVVHPLVYCLAFIDGGTNPADPIVIGAHQLEENLVHFDLHQSRVGFSSSLLNQRTNCSATSYRNRPGNP